VSILDVGRKMTTINVDLLNGISYVLTCFVGGVLIMTGGQFMLEVTVYYLHTHV
jgi:hypothetical protein